MSTYFEAVFKKLIDGWYIRFFLACAFFHIISLLGHREINIKIAMRFIVDCDCKGLVESCCDCTEI